MTYIQTEAATKLVKAVSYKPTAFAKRVMDMLTYKRPHGSASEAAFIDRFIKPVMDTHPSWSDEYGNMYVDLRTSPKHRTMFTSHVDTVHHTPGRQKVVNKGGVLTTVDGECLGADDGAGMAILLHMIQHKIPALYVFPRNEERGGVGARHIVEHHSALLSDFDRAVAFDRRADWSVITHQGGRCCSDEFAEALSEALSTDELMYAPDDTGVYTDTAEFTDIIAECCNVSTFYLNEHTKHESLDVVGLERLAAQVITVAWDDLPVERTPGEDDWPEAYRWGSTYTPPEPLEEAGPWWAFEGEVDEALGEALAGDPDELIYLAAVHYCETHNEPVMDTYQRMSAMPITMSMVQEADDDMYTCGAHTMLERLAQRLLPN